MPSDNDQRPFSGYESEESGPMMNQIRGHLVAAGSEFLGTTMFLWFAFAATQAAVQNGTAADSTEGLMFISLAFGFSLMVHAWAHYRISGGLFNPAVCASFTKLLILLISPGHSCPRHHQERASDTKCILGTCSVPRWYRGISTRAGNDPRRAGRCHSLGRWCISHSRTFHRSIRHIPPHLRHPYAGCREARNDSACSCWHRYGIVRGRIGLCTLYRWIPKPGSIFWTKCHDWRVSRVSLRLLVRQT